ncbi:TolC family protein [Bergeyella cardium]|uniref:TolC family protein n=1 Tax=Bergeyella cardium TaxID=1585976 RepID=A0A6P1QU91_9FLAO|nr:TolC family protein [Bergeyella cardium]QHN64747.1 TolC family protein [Bergeyella cardium]WHE34049.1 TolC family protein [Bergeyella cardium]WHF60700.1 TolC family protein [Bergeyella cardium]
MKRYIALVLGVASGVLAAQKRWSLEDCIRYAEEHNLEIRYAQKNSDIQQKNFDMARREGLPSVAGSVGNDFNFGQSQDVFGNNHSNNSFNNNAGLRASISVYNHSRLNKQIQKSGYEVEASRYDLEKTKNDIYVRIAKQYLTVLLNREVELINKSSYENAAKLLERAEKTTAAGTTAYTVLAEAKAAVAREFQNLKTAEINTHNALFDLAMLLQIEDYKSFDVAENPVLDIPERNAPISEEKLMEIYNSRPEIKSAEAKIRASEKQTEIAKTAFYPSISASAGVGTFYFRALNSDENKSFSQQYKDNFGQQLGVSATIPIFNKGITKLQVEQAKLSEELAKTNLQQQKQEVLQNVQRAEYTAQSNYEIYISAVEAEKSAELALDFAEKSYEAGRTTIYDVNIARNNYANAQGSVAQAKFNYIFQLKLLDFYAGLPFSL